jgi:hypothetical protein
LYERKELLKTEEEKS